MLPEMVQRGRRYRREETTGEILCDSLFARQQVDGVASCVLALERSDKSQSEKSDAMKPNLDLMRRIVLMVGEMNSNAVHQRLAEAGFSHDHVGYQVHLLQQAGLVTACDVANSGNIFPSALVTGLTVAGLEFAELARDDKRWNRATAPIKSRGSVDFPVLTLSLRSQDVTPFPVSNPDRGALHPGREYPRRMFHATKPEVTVSSSREEAQLGPEWSRTYVHRNYPSWRHHWTKDAIVVNSATEDAALGGGWGKPEAFSKYTGPRPIRTDDHDPTRWIGEWAVPGLLPDHQVKIRSHLLRADAMFERSADPDVGALSAMREAFDGIAETLFNAGILTEEVLRLALPQLVWESAIAGAWWRLASESPSTIFPERIGRYWVWREGSLEAQGLFRAETCLWRAAILDAPGHPGKSKTQADEPLAHVPSTPSAQGPDGITVRPDPKALVDAARLRLGLRSYDKLASRVGIGRDTLFVVKNETRWVSDQNYALLAEACHCKPEDLHPVELPKPPSRRR